MKLNEKWQKTLSMIDHAFQPLINPQTGETYAVEALIRNVDLAGYNSIESFFDAAYAEKVLFALDVELRKKALLKFKEIAFHHEIKLFYNYDPRILEMPDHYFGTSETLLSHLNLTNDILCFELNERYQFSQFKNFEKLLESFKERGIKLALDDFGAGFSSFELFYHSEPDCLKFDRFLISGIDTDYKKQTFCRYIVNLAKLMGVIVVAEGVETREEFEMCRKIGFDLIQGYYIQRPTTASGDILRRYSALVPQDDPANLQSPDFQLISNQIIHLDTIGVHDNVKVLFDKFHDNLQFNFFPVLDRSGFPLGIIHEKVIKKYVYSPYGKDLLCNKSVTNSLRKFISHCPVCDINTPQEKILEVYINNPDSEGVIITYIQKYHGFLSAKSLLNIINEKNLALAREVNPLTKLPGNILIKQYIDEIYTRMNHNYLLIYYDLDNFKPFNDRFGFALGDKVIGLFADLLKRNYHVSDSFIGHIGGDDFFVGIEVDTRYMTDELERIGKIVENFNQSVRVFYSDMENKKGIYLAKDRKGKMREFPLLSVSAAVVSLTKKNRGVGPDEIFKKLAGLKKEAKESPTKSVYFLG